MRWREGDEKFVYSGSFDEKGKFTGKGRLYVTQASYRTPLESTRENFGTESRKALASSNLTPGYATKAITMLTLRTDVGASSTPTAPSHFAGNSLMDYLMVRAMRLIKRG